MGVHDSARRTRRVGRPGPGASRRRIPERSGQVVRPRGPNGRPIRSSPSGGGPGSRRRLRPGQRRVRVVPGGPSRGPPSGRDESGFPRPVGLQGGGGARPPHGRRRSSRSSVFALGGGYLVPQGRASGGGARGVRIAEGGGCGGGRGGGQSRGRAPRAWADARSGGEFSDGGRGRPGAGRGAQQTPVAPTPTWP